MTSEAEKKSAEELANEYTNKHAPINAYYANTPDIATVRSCMRHAFLAGRASRDGEFEEIKREYFEAGQDSVQIDGYFPCTSLEDYEKEKRGGKE